jgi:putative protease
MIELEQEKPIGKIWHYYSHAHVGIIELTDGEIDLGNVIHIKGAHTDFRQQVESLQLDHQNIAHADKGKRVGVQLKEKVRENDTVYLEMDFRNFASPPC